MDRKNSISTNAKNSLSDCGGIELDEDRNNEMIIYVNEEGEEEEEASGFCFYISYPYRRATQTSAAKWTKKQFLRVTQWMHKKDELHEENLEKKEEVAEEKQERSSGKKIEEP